MLPFETDVLIVGAGPTGLALACALQQAGVDHVLIDERTESENTSRAAVVHALTLEALDKIGVAAPLGALGRRLERFAIRDRDRRLLEIGFANLPSAFRHILMVPQSTTESQLEQRLTELGGQVRKGVSAVNTMRDGEGAVAVVKSAAGEKSIRARYVIGADGMHSMVRKAAGIGFPGEAYNASFVLADVRMDWPLGADEVSLFFSSAGLVVVAPLPDGSFRVVATVDNAPEQSTVGEIQRLLDARGPTHAPCRVEEIVWTSRFRVHHRLADSYRNGPFLLIGDAAHVHSPAGGQGMNTGMVDSILLGEALTRVVRDGAPESALDDYARLRRPAAQEVLHLVGRLTRIATLRAPSARWMRNLVLRGLNRIAPFKRKVMLALSGLSRRRFSILPAKVRAQPLERRPAALPTLVTPRLHMQLVD
jgi:2-polyprenyl-6-methoxyphenol hydroxylase-like FAD-dependent oxidoreductase